MHLLLLSAVRHWGTSEKNLESERHFPHNKIYCTYALTHSLLPAALSTWTNQPSFSVPFSLCPAHLLFEKSRNRQGGKRVKVPGSGSQKWYPEPTFQDVPSCRDLSCAGKYSSSKALGHTMPIWAEKMKLKTLLCILRSPKTVFLNLCPS